MIIDWLIDASISFLRRYQLFQVSFIFVPFCVRFIGTSVDDSRDVGDEGAKLEIRLRFPEVKGFPFPLAFLFVL
jgi:hypothetical protein